MESFVMEKNVWFISWIPPSKRWNNDCLELGSKMLDISGRHVKGLRGSEKLVYHFPSHPRPLQLMNWGSCGLHRTRDTLVHAGVVDNATCKFCNQPDSVFHRHWECRSTEESRNLIPPEIQQFVLASPPCLSERGWAIEPESVQVFRASLATIPDRLGAYVQVPVNQLHVDLFCDGTGIDPKCPLTRMVAWGVVLAGAHPQQPHTPLAWGGVPGQLQTVVRAELFAFVSALLYAQNHLRTKGHTCAIWSDCEIIVRRARALQQGLMQIHSAMADHDLWQVVEAIIPAEELCQVYHIKSHQAYQDDLAWIQWACSANDAADKLAELAIDSLPSHVKQAQAAASASQAIMKTAVTHVHQHIVRVAKLSVAADDKPQMAPVRTEQVPEVNWSQVAIAAADRAPPKLRFDGFHKAVSWLQAVHDGAAPMRWISWYELLIAFRLQTGEWGIQSTSSHNTWQIHNKIHEFDMRESCRSWAAYLLQFIRLVLPGFKAEHNRPSNSRFHCWSMGILTRMSEKADTLVHQWLQEQFGDKPISKMASLFCLPAATLSTVPEPTPVAHGLHRFWPQ